MSARRVCWLLLFALASGLGAGCGAPVSTYDRVLARGELVVGVKDDSPPFGVRDAKDGSYWGFDVDLAAKIAEKLGVPVRYVPVRSATRIGLLNDGTVDLLAAAMTITRERERLVDFSLPYFATEQAFLVPQAAAIAGYADLARKKVAAVSGTTSLDNLKEVQPDAELVAFDDYPRALAALKAGQVDALTTDFVLLSGINTEEQSRSGKDEFKIVGRFGSEPYGLALRENDSKFRDAVNTILQELWDRGTLQGLIENWFNERGRFPVKVQFNMITFPKGAPAK